MISGVEKVPALRFLYWKGTCLETRDEPNGLFRLSKKVLSLRHEHPSSLLGLPKKILVMLSTCCATSSSFVWSDHFLVDGMELSSNHTGSCYRWSEKSLSVCVWDIEDKKIEDKAGKLTTVQNAIFLGNIKERPSRIKSHVNTSVEKESENILSISQFTELWDTFFLYSHLHVPYNIIQWLFICNADNVNVIQVIWQEILIFTWW